MVVRSWRCRAHSLLSSARRAQPKEVSSASHSSSLLRLATQSSSMLSSAIHISSLLSSATYSSSHLSSARRGQLIPRELGQKRSALPQEASLASHSSSLLRLATYSSSLLSWAIHSSSLLSSAIHSSSLPSSAIHSSSLLSSATYNSSHLSLARRGQLIPRGLGQKRLAHPKRAGPEEVSSAPRGQLDQKRLVRPEELSHAAHPLRPLRLKGPYLRL